MLYSTPLDFPTVFSISFLSFCPFVCRRFPQTVPSIHQYLDRLIKSKPIPGTNYQFFIAYLQFFFTELVLSDSIFTNCTVLGALPFSSDACKLLLSSFPDTAGQDSKVSGALMNCFDECITNFAVSGFFLLQIRLWFVWKFFNHIFRLFQRVRNCCRHW
jgi:hypothetical protein